MIRRSPRSTPTDTPVPYPTLFPSLLYFSSGGALYADAGGGWSTESDIVRPRSYHGVAKPASENLIAAWCGQAEGTAIALRPSNVYGPGHNGKGGFAIIPTTLGRYERGDPLVGWGGEIGGASGRDEVGSTQEVQGES